MSTYYVDPAASGSNNGTSWTDAWTNVQTAFDTATAGDVVYCRGTQTLTATIDVDTNKGSIASGRITFIGTNASGTEDGTRFALDGNSAATYCLQLVDADYYSFFNMEFKNATSSGVFFNTSYSTSVIFNNCTSHNNGGWGFSCGVYADGPTFFRSAAYSNNSGGFDFYARAKLFFCRAYNHLNNTSGFRVSSTNCLFIGCLAYNNTANGFDVTGTASGCTFLNCVSDSNTNGNGDEGFHSSASGTHHLIIGCRITNHNDTSDVGIDWSYGQVLECWNYFQNNTTNISYATRTISLTADGAATSQADQGDTESGYVDQDSPEDFNLTANATLRRTAITIPES